MLKTADQVDNQVDKLPRFYHRVRAGSRTSNGELEYLRSSIGDDKACSARPFGILSARKGQIQGMDGMKIASMVVLLVSLAWPGYQSAQTGPQIDDHQHLFNSEITKLAKG